MPAIPTTLATPATRVIGSYLSPYVRKVLVSLEMKGVPYQVDPIVPFYGNDEFEKLSPLRRVPVLIDDQVSISDSTVICEYLEERYPSPALLPRGAADRARARWLEEFADTRMGDVIVWRLFAQVAIRRAVWGEPADDAVVTQARDVELPAIQDLLEREAPVQGFLFGEVSIADIAVAAMFRNAAFARWRIDAARWPRTASWVERTLALPAFTTLTRFEDLIARVPIAQQRDALVAGGAPIAAHSVGSQTPRRGVMASV